MGYTRSISNSALENAMWHFNNNMAAIMDADRLEYNHAREDIAYLLELHEKQNVEKTETVSQACPRCGCPVNRCFCQNCGQALKLKI